MVQVPNYMGHEYDVEQNMNIFETQIQQYQRALSDINLQYMAVKHMSAEEKVYWNSYQDYLSWAIDNAKAGWNLFNKYGKEVFKNKGLIKGYWRIIPPHSVLMTEIRGIFNLPIENSFR